MHKILICLLWISIGLGVVVGSAKRAGVELPKDGAVLLIGAALWPAIVVADFYGEKK